MGAIVGGSPSSGGVQSQPAAAPAPAAIIYQSDDPYAPNYKPPVGAVLSPAQKAAQAAKEAATRPLAPVDETDEERLERQRRSSLILGAGYEMWGGGGGSDNGNSGGAADAGSSDGGSSGDGSAY